jgi:hypothetical protein
MRFAQAFAGAAFEEDVVRNNDGGATVLLQEFAHRARAKLVPAQLLADDFDF